MQFNSQLRLWLAVIVGIAVAVMLIYPAVDGMNGLAPNSAPTHAWARKHAALFALGIAFSSTLASDLFAPFVSQHFASVRNNLLDSSAPAEYRCSLVPRLC
jgi:hypothetical protein